jgi:hypothetical protein
VYVLSDFAQATIAAWRRHPQLRTFMEAGQLDFRPLRYRTQPGADTARERAACGAEHGHHPLWWHWPTIFFDGCRGRLLRQGGPLAEALVTVRGPEGASFDGVKLSWSARPINDNYGDREIYAVLAEYRARLPDTTLPFPVAGLRCCRTLRAIACDPLLVLSA